MRIKISKLLLLFLVSLSFFRVDLSAGLLSFAVSPPLLLSGIIIIIFLGSCLQKQWNQKHIVIFASFLILLLLYYLLTIIFNYHGSLQIKRFLLFFEIILSSVAFLSLFDKLTLYSREDILRKWIKYSINTHLIWITIQIYFFIKGYHFYNESWETWKFINPLPHTIGPYFPRLEGGFLDPNVCGYYYSFLYFISRALKIDSTKNNYLLVLFVLLTVSRSAIAAFIICLILFKFISIRLNIKKVIGSIYIFLIFITLSCGIISYFGLWNIMVKAIVIRFTDKGSSNIHNDLILLGIRETLSNVKTFIFGNGFSSSPYFAYDLLKSTGNDWKYANFHSEYISMFFEGGVIGFSIFYFVLLFPFLYLEKLSLKLLPILLLMLLQGIFYQQYNFHYYWIILTIVMTLNYTRKNATDEKKLLFNN